MVPAFILQEEFLIFVTLLILFLELLLLVVIFRMYFRQRGIHPPIAPDALPAQHAGIPLPATTNPINESGHSPDPDQNLGISENLHRILDKYDLQRLTISTDDGLVVASSDAGAEQEAAALSHIYRSWGGSDMDTLTVFGIPHKEANLVGIVKRSKVLSGTDLEGIEADIGLVISWYT